MLEKYLLTNQAQLELFGTQFTRLKEELEKRDLSDIPTLPGTGLLVEFTREA
jgi:hypothetical protein